MAEVALRRYRGMHESGQDGCPEAAGPVLHGGAEVPPRAKLDRVPSRVCPRKCVGMNERDRHAIDKQNAEGQDQ